MAPALQTAPLPPPPRFSIILCDMNDSIPRDVDALPLTLAPIVAFDIGSVKIKIHSIHIAD